MHRTFPWLAGATILEVLWAVSLDESQGFTLPGPGLLAVLAFMLALGCLAAGCRRLDDGRAAAIWIGSAGADVVVLAALAGCGRLPPGRALGLCLVATGLHVLVARVLCVSSSSPEPALSWQPGLDNGARCLGELFDEMPTTPGAPIPWYVRLVSDPRGPLAAPGSLALLERRCIHILLGRGLTSRDQAFVAGFTAGTTRPGRRWRLRLFRFYMRHLCPRSARWSRAEDEIFAYGFEAGRRGATSPLHRAPFLGLMDRPLAEIREALGLDVDYLYLRYDLERVRWPCGPELAPPRPAPADEGAATNVYFAARYSTQTSEGPR
jgi:quaternary ammonium compound-resistance protein SugE